MQNDKERQIQKKIKKVHMHVHAQVCLSVISAAVIGFLWQWANLK